MKRRVFIGLVGGAAATWPLTVRAQQPLKARRIAFVHSGIPADKLTETGGTFWVRRFFEELRRLGYAEGANLVVERFSADGNASRYAALAAEVVSRKPEVIVVNHNVLTKAFTTATATIPIVAITSDPIVTGLITNFARPGANLTGVSINAGIGIVAKRLQILKEAVPAAARITYLAQTGAEWKAGLESSLHGAGQRFGIAVIGKVLDEVNEAQLRRAFDEMAEQKIDAAIIDEGGSFLANRAFIVALAEKHRLPTIYPYRDYAELGGLVAYGPDLGELAKRMASDVHQILGGAKPGDIPIYQPTKFVMALNLKTAKTLGLTVPPLVLAQADEVIE